MPRKSRIDIAGALHHVIARGIEKGLIFRDARDYDFFLSRLNKVLVETQTSCCAWALLPNHFHLLLRTGDLPLATVMRRLMTGHAISFNRRHERVGHLFQNRYKSILCQENAYFLELVRYIHLNPLRAGLVENLGQLEAYPYSGHGVIMGRQRQEWHNVKEVLSCFDNQTAAARKKYKAFIAKGVGQGHRADLTDGGVIRKDKGWTSTDMMRKAEGHVKSDERILGDSDFVTRVLSTANEAFEQKYALKTSGVNLDTVAANVAKLFGLTSADVWEKSRNRNLVAARSLICYLAARKLGWTMTSLARRFGISTAAVSKSVERGSEIIKDQNVDINKLIS